MTMIGHIVLEMIRQALGGHGLGRGPGQGPPRDTSAHATLSRSGTGLGGMGGVTAKYAADRGQVLARQPTPTTISPTLIKTTPTQPTTPILSKRLFTK